jgi:hypothetical protein
MALGLHGSNFDVDIKQEYDKVEMAAYLELASMSGTPNHLGHYDKIRSETRL